MKIHACNMKVMAQMLCWLHTESGNGNGNFIYIAHFITEKFNVNRDGSFGGRILLLGRRDKQGLVDVCR